jgi:ABC-type antimicrobial peptide transport system permease subunit
MFSSLHRMLARISAVACVAGYLPALRVSRIEPIEALRAS